MSHPKGWLLVYFVQQSTVGLLQSKLVSYAYKDHLAELVKRSFIIFPREGGLTVQVLDTKSRDF